MTARNTEQRFRTAQIKVVWKEFTFKEFNPSPITDWIKGLTKHEALEIADIYERHKFCESVEIVGGD